MFYRIAEVPGKDDGLFANTFIAKGVTILEEDPLVSVQFSWNKAYGYKVCNHCLRPLESAEECARRLTAKECIVLPYPELCETDKSKFSKCPACDELYCSVECRNRAFDQYHRTLCKNGNQNGDDPLSMLNEAWKQFHYPPETGSVMLIPRIIATIQQSPQPAEALRTLLQFRHRTSNADGKIVHKLLKDLFQTQIDTLLELTKNAVSQENVEALLTPEGFRALMALIGTNGQGIGSTPIGLWAKKALDLQVSDEEKKTINAYIDVLYEDMEAHCGSFLSNEGVALYRLQSKCNHSCNPNAIAAFLQNNHHLTLMALRDIQPGEEISISYLNECELGRCRYSRQKLLKENYLFVCECEKCTQEAHQPDTSSDDDAGNDSDEH